MASYSDEDGGEFETDENDNLIAVSKVNGTSVYYIAGDSLGSIFDVMGLLERAIFVRARGSFGVTASQPAPN